ncbi:KGG domain-containing protein [Abiotrophia defectiva]|uniref:KGG domain-containing protein n=1 Tax=Abiotrophia defectiva TaxID=46125 RepID=UPI003C71B42A
MASENLIPTNRRTKEEAREISRKGGKASGEARRRKADLKKALKTVLEADVHSDKVAEQLDKMGFDNSNLMAMVFAQMQQAQKGNVRAFEAISKVMGVEKDELDRKEQRQRIKALELELAEKKKRLEALEQATAGLNIEITPIPEVADSDTDG